MLTLDELLRRFSEDLGHLVDPGPNGGFLLAVSGGADSTALLRLFQLLRDRALQTKPLPRLVVGHVHHGIRGAAADSDAEFVKELASRWGMEFVLGEISVPELARKTARSAETTARDERYSLLSRWAEERDLDYVVTAHHRGDQEETVLLRVARGTGIHGLAGIPPRRTIRHSSGGKTRFVVRPLLTWKREHLDAFLRTINQPFCQDHTNSDWSIPRNAVRSEVLPLLRERVHPGVSASLNRLATVARQLLEDLDTLSQEKWPFVVEQVEGGGSGMTLSLLALRQLPPSIQDRLLRKAIETVSRRLGREAPPLSMSQEAEIFRRILQRRAKDRVETGGWRFESDGELLRVDAPSEVPEKDESGVLSPLTPVLLSDRAEATWGSWSIRFETLESPVAIPRDDPFSEVFDAERLQGPLSIRTRRPGERFHPLGSRGTKRLKEFFRECGVSTAERDTLPLVFSGDILLWVVGRRLAHPFRVTPSTRRWGKLTARLER